MSTNAMIGFSQDGVKAVYSHWDGYPTEMGRNLVKFFPTLFSLFAIKFDATDRIF